MVTAEGVFPKTGNDPIYASEINRFSPKLIGYVDQNIYMNISGAAYIPMGASITYPGAGSMQINEFMEVKTIGQKADATNLAINFRLRISGTAGLNMVTSSKGTSALTTQDVYNFNHIFTSGAITASGGNVGSSYVITFEGNSASDLQARTGDFVIIGY